MVTNDTSLRFSLWRLFVVTAIYALSMPMWRISPFHGIAGFVAATSLSGLVLLAKRKEYFQLVLKLASPIAFGILGGLVCELALSGAGPTDDIIIYIYSATAFSALIGWVLGSRIGGRKRRDS